MDDAVITGALVTEVATASWELDACRMATPCDDGGLYWLIGCYDVGTGRFCAFVSHLCEAVDVAILVNRAMTDWQQRPLSLRTDSHRRWIDAIAYLDCWGIRLPHELSVWRGVQHIERTLGQLNRHLAGGAFVDGEDLQRCVDLWYPALGAFEPGRR